MVIACASQTIDPIRRVAQGLEFDPLLEHIFDSFLSFLGCLGSFGSQGSVSAWWAHCSTRSLWNVCSRRLSIEEWDGASTCLDYPYTCEPIGIIGNFFGAYPMDPLMIILKRLDMVNIHDSDDLLLSPVIETSGLICSLRDA